MNNYELAKQLKDAGFPQVGLRYTWYYSTKPMGCFNSGEKYLDVKNHPDRIVIPTLSELIEACGEDFDSMYRGSDGSWLAEQPMCLDEGENEPHKCKGEGSTPEEAVAKLWLELNKK